MKIKMEARAFLEIYCKRIVFYDTSGKITDFFKHLYQGNSIKTYQEEECQAVNPESILSLLDLAEALVANDGSMPAGDLFYCLRQGETVRSFLQKNPTMSAFTVKKILELAEKLITNDVVERD